jgi:hypothetical protein
MEGRLHDKYHQVIALGQMRRGRTKWPRHKLWVMIHMGHCLDNKELHSFTALSTPTLGQRVKTRDLHMVVY